MTVRTTSISVQGIVEVDSAIALTPFIAAASSVVTSRCVDLYTTAVYSDETLELIERWLAAHFYLIRDRRAKSESMGGASASYHDAGRIGLESTEYGQMAMALDTAGGLAALNKMMNNGGVTSASIQWLGKAQEVS